MSRSCGFVKEDAAELGKGWKMIYKVFMKPMLSKGTSVIAVNDKDEIVGMKIGRAVDITDKK